MRLLILSICLLCNWASQAQHPELVVQRGHNAPITDIAMSADGQLLLTGGWDRNAKLWDFETGKELRTYSEITGYFSFVKVAFSPNNQHIAVAGEDGSLNILEVNTGRRITNFQTKTEIVGAICFSETGAFLFSGSGKGMIHVWEATTGQLVDSITAHSKRIEHLKLSTNGKTLVSGSEDGTIGIWDAKSLKKIKIAQAHQDKVTALSVGKKLIASVGLDNVIRIHKLNNGELVETIEGLEEFVLAIDFDASEEVLATATAQATGQIQFWDIQTKEIINEIPNAGLNINALKFTPDNQYIICNNQQQLVVWNVETLQKSKTLGGYLGDAYGDFVNTIAFSPNGRYLASGGGDEWIRIWGDEMGKSLKSAAAITAIAFHPDNRHLVVGNKKGHLEVWDILSGKMIQQITEHTGKINTLQFTNGGNYLFTASDDKTVKMWFGSTENQQLATFQLRKTFEGHRGKVKDVALSPRGLKLISGDNKGFVHLWDLSDKTLSHTYDNNGVGITAVEFTKDGFYVLGGTQEGMIKVWDVQNDDLIYQVQSHDGALNTMTSSPSGQYVVTGGEDKTLTVWDVITVEVAEFLIGHTESVNTVTFSPKGKNFVSSANDNTIKLWDMEEGDLKATIYALGESDWAVVAPNGMFDASTNAMEIMHYVVGIESIDLEQLKERYYEPDLLQKLLGNNKEGLRTANYLDQVALYPQVEATLKGKDKLDIQLTQREGGIGKVSIFINKKEVIENANPQLKENLMIDIAPYEKYLIANGTNNIGIKAYNKQGWLSSRMINVPLSYGVNTKGDGKKSIKLKSLRKTTVPHLYGLVIGTSDYSGETLDLSYADKDATDMATSLMLAGKTLFGESNVHIDLMTTASYNPPTKESILRALENLATQANPQDVLVVYVSGHGTNYGGYEEEQFYYLTKDLATGDISDQIIRENYAISTNEFTEAFKSIPSNKQIMIIDACSSGSLVDNLLASTRNLSSSQRRALDRMKDRTGMFVLAGSAADKVSYEASQFGQGLLTYSLLSGMKGAALRENEFVDIMQLFQYAADKVPEFAAYIGGIQRPVIAAPSGSNSFDIGQVTEEVKAQIPLVEVKPLFIRSNFQEESAYDDLLDLADRTDKKLAEIASDAAAANLIFVDVKKYPNAYAIKGRYSLDGEQVNLIGRIFQNKIEIGSFEVVGSVDNLDGLLNEMFIQVQDLISVF